MNRKSIAIALGAVLLYLGWSSFFIVDERELAIVLQFGEWKRSASQPGPQFKLPYETVQKMESRILSSDAAADAYLTLDKKRLVADPVTRWKIVDPLVFYQRVNDEVAAKTRIDAIVNSEMRRELAGRNFGEIIGNARDPLMLRVTQEARKKIDDFGIHVVDIRIKRADLPKEVQESVFQRMRAERDRVAKRYRSEGAEEAAKVRADTDKEKTILLAEAYEASQRLRGDGDAESISIYANAFNADPEFYAFMRSLETYEKAIGADTNLVLSTGSDLFRYFNQQQK
ncbi:MAG: protease modulator HflC [Polyangiaceae bacterium]|nr:protease modulator HflC [Polyangiaceae bacterium]